MIGPGQVVVARREAMASPEEAEYETPPKQVLTLVALELCGLEHAQRQQTRFLIGPPEEYVHGHTAYHADAEQMKLGGPL